MAVRNGTIVIGVPGRDADNGAIYVYRRGAGGEWNEEPVLSVDVAGDGRIGSSLAIDGSHVLTGAPGRNGTLSRTAHIRRYR